MATKRMLVRNCGTCVYNVYGPTTPKECVECGRNDNWESRYTIPVMFDEGVLRQVGPTSYSVIDIQNVIFNPPATIVFWTDGTKTVVKCAEDDEFDPEKGMAMAISKKIFGNQGSYYNKIKKWTEQYDPRSAIEKMADSIDELRKKYNDSILEQLEVVRGLKDGTRKMRLVKADINSLKGKKGK